MDDQKEKQPKKEGQVVPAAQDTKVCPNCGQPVIRPYRTSLGFVCPNCSWAL